MKITLFRTTSFLAVVLFVFSAGSTMLVHADAPVNNWIRTITPGFGNKNNMAIYAMEEFNSYLYAGTLNYFDGAEIWRSPDGRDWTNVMRGGFHNSRQHRAIQDFVVFDGSLYAATACSIIHDFCNHAEIWRSTDGLQWTEITFPTDIQVEIVPTMVVYRNALYISLGRRIYMMNDTSPATWTLLKEFLDGSTFSSMVVYKDQLYAGGATFAGTFSEPARIYRYDPPTGWQIVNEPNGENVFNSVDSYQIGDFGIFQDTLYVGLRNAQTGGQIWKTSDATVWTQVMANGFGNTNNIMIMGFTQNENHLFALTGNFIEGMQVWQYEKNATWQQVNKSGFGESDNVTENSGKSMAVFRGNLYVGTMNASIDGGAEIWMLLGKNIAIPYMFNRID